MVVLRQFSLAFKLKIIKYYERLQASNPPLPITERSLGFVSKKVKISRQCLRDWLKKRIEISEEVNKHLRFKTKPSNTKCLCDEMERRLTVWLQAEREKGAFDSLILKTHVVFHFKLLNILSANVYTEGQLLNMDETAIYLDCPTNYTYAHIGIKRVKASTAGGERTRVSAAFTAAANGHKLPMFAIIPRVTPLPELDAIQNLRFKSQYSFSL